jgi:hypothetical protein
MGAAMNSADHFPEETPDFDKILNGFVRARSFISLASRAIGDMPDGPADEAVCLSHGLKLFDKAHLALDHAVTVYNAGKQEREDRANAAKGT